MKKVVHTLYQTMDGATHASIEAAWKYAEAKYANALSRLAHRAVQMDKYSRMTEFIDANLDLFVEASRLKRDMVEEKSVDEG